MQLNTAVILNYLENHWDWSYTFVHPMWMLQHSLYWVNVCLLLQSTTLVLWGKIFELNNTSLEQIFNLIHLLKYRYIGSFPSDLVPTLPNDTLANINTQPSNIPREHWIMIAMFHHAMYFADSLGISIKNYPFSSKMQANDSDKTARTSQCMRFLHNLCSISSVQISTGGLNCR